MSKHTPGPWLRDVPNDDDIYGADQKTVCTIWGKEPHDHEQIEANANLIAAAPEMWDALQMCKDRLGKDFPQIGHDALAKAEGRQ